MNKVLASIRCGSCRFTAFYFLSFYIPLLDSGLGRNWQWILFGAFFWFLNCLGTEWLNRLSDYTEDQFNRPERTAICKFVGYENIKKLSILVWSIILIIDLSWLTIYPSLFLGLCLFIGFLVCINYSIVLRFKSKKYLSLVALTMVFVLPFLAGSSVSLANQDMNLGIALISKSFPFLTVLILFIWSIAGIKDITDIKGDEIIGYQGLWTSFVKNKSNLMIVILISLPFAGIITMNLVGLLPLKFISLLIFYPVSFLLAMGTISATEIEQREALRELMYQYQFVFFAFSLFLYSLKMVSFITIVCTIFYWIIATQYLHWSDGFRMNKMKSLVNFFV